MDVSGKKIAILGGTRITCQLVEAAKALGMHVTVIDYNPPEQSPAKLVADEHALISVADVDEVAAYIREHNIDGAMTGYADAILGWYADICEKAGIPCYGTHEQFDIFVDKRRWKALCREFGVPTSREYDGEAVASKPDSVPYPLMVKPVDSSGARGVYVVRSASEFGELYERSMGFSKSGRVLVEDYLEGPEVTVFWVFIDGEYRVFLLGNRHVKHNQEGVIPLPAGYTFPASVLPGYLDEVAPNVCKMLKSVGVRDGMMFMQCIVRDGVPYVYDIGYRTTGSLEQHITADVAGYSPIDMMLCHAVTGCMTDDEEIFEKIERGLFASTFNISCLMRPGTIDHFDGLNALDASENVIKYVKAHVEGETLPPEAKGQLRQIALRVLGKTSDVSELRDVMLELQEAVKIVSPDGENLMLPGLEASDFVSVILGA